MATISNIEIYFSRLKIREGKGRGGKGREGGGKGREGGGEDR